MKKIPHQLKSYSRHQSVSYVYTKLTKTNGMTNSA